MTTPSSLAAARAVADAVLYEGYLLYPYRASAGKNQCRWQFGVLGPPGAAEAGAGEEPGLTSELLLIHRGPDELTVWLRCLQLQRRDVERVDAAGGFVPVPDLCVEGRQWLSWDEAVEHEVPVATTTLTAEGGRVTYAVDLTGGEDVAELRSGAGKLVGRLVRRRWPLTASVHVAWAPVPGDEGVSRLEVEVENTGRPADPGDKVEATRRSFLGAHLLLGCTGGVFVSMTDPPPELAGVAAGCHQQRCWPVLAGPAGQDDVLLVSPIILEDHPTLAARSPGSLFDSTEIDEILTLRILTMTEQEKAEARATDARAGEIIDRSERLSEAEMAGLHGAMYAPSGAGSPGPGPVPAEGHGSGDVPWWDPESDAAVDPASDAVVVAGTRVSRGSLVVLRPGRRADAQDLFLAGQTARVTGVHTDVDGATHVGVVLVDDPAADLHEWYGRYLYFGPDELEPLGTTAAGPDTRRRTET
jgi:hypothetical protein